jgi:hypothetical protein
MIHRLTRAARKAVLLATAVAAVLPAASAQAALIETDPCDDAVLRQAFSRWGDGAWYKLAPGGDMERGLTGFRVSGGATTVADSEPWGVTGRVGTRALKLPQGASVTLPPTCVNAGNPTFRFFSRSSGGLLGLLPLLKVDVVYGSGLLKSIPVVAGTALPSAKWGPSLPALTSSILGATVAGGEAPVSIRFTAALGTWYIDDVLVDPFRRA